jgi:hypothetical protein
VIAELFYRSKNSEPGGFANIVSILQGGADGRYRQVEMMSKILQADSHGV